MDPQQLTSMAHKFQAVLDADVLNERGEQLGFCQRQRLITPFRFGLSVIASMATEQVASLADLHRQFNDLWDGESTYKAFYNQMLKASWGEFLRTSLCDIIGTISHVDGVRLRVAMSIVVPKGRKYLCADALFRLLREHFATIADDRVDEVEIPLSDALMSAFAMFSLKAPSLLAFDKQRAEGNLKTIYGIAHTPCDTRMRERLDPVSPESLRPSFTLVFRQLQRGKALEPMAFLDGHYLVALDGTGYFSSKTIHCASCLHKEHRNGSITYYHQMLGAAIIHPDCREVIPLMPEPMVKQDGTQKNDCERNAAKRFITKLRQDHPHLKVLIIEDALSSNAPHIETLHDYGCHYILGVKEGDHAYLFTQVQAAEEAGRVTYYERHDRAAEVVHAFRFVNDMPLNGSRGDVRVNFIEDWERGPEQVQHFRGVTDLRLRKPNVYKP